ncbi:hypothetical protein [Leptospira sp. GIMC2001]|uniref:hypothetical protein n=1 Tax=Leptospira sp. GIMC2001 TaxID=1513297 RepID=UPI00234A2BBF|nr:hypothetical protein [Leptospira sp. GIMC2001]WCL51041.1 hypothetical protein O4O04_09575 [Leptospira sp. GIMC2001]
MLYFKGITIFLLLLFLLLLLPFFAILFVLYPDLIGFEIPGYLLSFFVSIVFLIYIEINIQLLKYIKNKIMLIISLSILILILIMHLSFLNLSPEYLMYIFEESILFKNLIYYSLLYLQLIAIFIISYGVNVIKMKNEKKKVNIFDVLIDAFLIYFYIPFGVFLIHDKLNKLFYKEERSINN